MSLEQRLSQHLQEIAVERDPFENRDQLQKVQQYVEARLKEYGFSIERDPFPFQGKTFENLIASLPQSPPGDPFLIAAHIDAVPGSPGADDNASGVAVLLELARHLGTDPPPFPLLFAPFNLEEYNMVGSSHYVRRLRKERKRVRGMISLEMVGYVDKRPKSQSYPLGLSHFYPSEGNFIALVGDTRSKKLLGSFGALLRKSQHIPVETLLLPLRGWLLPAVRLSDHSPFWDAGLPALLVTDTSFYRNPHYHLPSDTIETLNLSFMAGLTEGLIEALSQFPT